MSTKDQIAATDREYWLGHTAHFRRQNRRKVLVAGADEGSIGAGIARGYTFVGHQVFAPPRVYETYGNLARGRNAAALLHAATEHFGTPPDVLVSCVGYTDLSWIELQEPPVVEEVIESSLTAPLQLARAFAQMTIREQHLKDLVLIGSMARRKVLTASAAYCAAKAGLAQYVENAGWELSPKGFRVVGIHPSNTAGTPMTEDTVEGIMAYRGLSREAAEEYWGAVRCFPRWLSPHDIYKACNAFTSGQLDYASGSNIDLPGGAR